MAMGLFQVCLVVVIAIINHPLLFPWENKEEIIREMQEHQEKLQLEHLCLEEEVAQLAAKKEALEQVTEEGQKQPEGRAAWDLWSALCMILLLIFKVWLQDHKEQPLPECLGSNEDELSGLGGPHCRASPCPIRPH
jgi:hypothetical protein